MEMIMDVFNEDRMVHPKQAHVFVVRRLMTNLLRKQLGKDANDLMIIPARDHFWDKSQHEPLILAIVLPFAYIQI